MRIRQLMQHRIFLPAVAAAALISCTQDRSPAPTGPDVDKAVIAAVLEDFANWKEVTFGELEGVLELKPDSLANPDGTAQGVKALASEITDQLDDEAVAAFVERNRAAVPVASLFAGSRWARVRPPTATDAYSLGPPDGAKAVGYLTLPGYSADGSRALLQIRHSWSMHGAVVTYVLSREQGHWKVVARDQAVFL
jgi:hypothetical protein